MFFSELMRGVMEKRRAQTPPSSELLQYERQRVELASTRNVHWQSIALLDDSDRSAFVTEKEN
jgi:hypothetical protein